MLLAGGLMLLAPLSHGLRLHSYFTPGMVLQSDTSNTIWGFDAVAEVTASLSCNGRSWQPLGVTTRADGLWEVELPSRSAGSQCDFQASTDTEDLVLTDILFGDVWLCSGQSNMEQSMKNIINSTEEIAASASFTSIRFTVVKNAVSATADGDADVELQQAWADPGDAAMLGGMSAVCFLYARSLHQHWVALGMDPVPLGLVDSDWGGTPIEAWSTPESLASCEATRGCNEERPQSCPNRLYNAMIHPLARVSLKGFLWYQGEANGNLNSNRDLYNCMFPAMIDSWRQLFSANSGTASDAPFGFVQLASWRPDTLDAGFPVIRWHLTADFGYVPNDRLHNVFMASPLDTYDDKEGYPGGIHPRYKPIVGERLAVAGLYVAYGVQEEPYRPYGPLPASVTFDSNNLITVKFSDNIVYDKSEISGFYVCASDPVACDSTNTLDSWVEVEQAAVVMVDSTTLTISVELPSESFSLAYAWRETPVKRYLGLPLYGDEEHLSLPSPPWKKACGAGSCH